MKPRVVLVDDHELFLSGVRAELGERVEIVGEAGNVADAVPVIREQDPDVVLLDVHLPDGSGDAIIHAVAAERPGVRFLALSVAVHPPVTLLRPSGTTASQNGSGGGRSSAGSSLH